MPEGRVGQFGTSWYCWAWAFAAAGAAIATSAAQSTSERV
jgi:hypothetical protein